MGHESLLTGWGLRTIELSDRAVFEAHLDALARPLSDYTFSQIYTWRNSLRLMWKIVRGHLCVFANGAGDLTLLLPPIGDTAGDAAMSESFELMDQYNAELATPQNPRSRVEYVSDELLARFDSSRLHVEPMGGDYVYDTRLMIDLPGGALASKRQAKSRFLRNYQSRIETYDAARHLQGCLELLQQWKTHQDVQHIGDSGAVAIKRQKEAIATELALHNATELGLKGMVVRVAQDDGERIAGFTFGEYLGRDQSSIVIEKTNLSVKGLAQYIFSEFCRNCWSDRPLVNAGDDWGLESLAWTKSSYRPVKLLKKYVVRGRAAAACGLTVRGASDGAAAAINLRAARSDDFPAIADLESRCFDVFVLTERKLARLERGGAIMRVAEQSGKIIGEGIALLCRRRAGVVGRIYTLAVDADHRGRRIGHRILIALIDELARRSVRQVELEVERSNRGAIRLYETLGFRAGRVLEEYYGVNRDGMRMTLRLPMPSVLTPAA